MQTGHFLCSIFLQLYVIHDRTGHTEPDTLFIAAICPGQEIRILSRGPTSNWEVPNMKIGFLDYATALSEELKLKMQLKAIDSFCFHWHGCIKWLYILVSYLLNACSVDSSLFWSSHTHIWSAQQMYCMGREEKDATRYLLVTYLPENKKIR